MLTDEGDFQVYVQAFVVLSAMLYEQEDFLSGDILILNELAHYVTIMMISLFSTSHRLLCESHTGTAIN